VRIEGATPASEDRYSALRDTIISGKPFVVVRSDSENRDNCGLVFVEHALPELRSTEHQRSKTFCAWNGDLSHELATSVPLSRYEQSARCAPARAGAEFGTRCPKTHRRRYTIPCPLCDTLWVKESDRPRSRPTRCLILNPGFGIFRMPPIVSVAGRPGRLPCQAKSGHCGPSPVSQVAFTPKVWWRPTTRPPVLPAGHHRGEQTSPAWLWIAGFATH
jgi:hypothetical protein